MTSLAILRNDFLSNSRALSNGQKSEGDVQTLLHTLAFYDRSYANYEAQSPSWWLNFFDSQPIFSFC